MQLKLIQSLLAPDKLLHFTSGFFIFCAMWVVSPHQGINIAVVAAAGWFKEYYDATYGSGVFDWLDLFATIAGGILAHLFINKITQ